MLGGLPGSGKSTIAEKFIQRSFLSICKDTIRYELAKRQYGDMPESLLDEYLQKYGKCCYPIIADMIESFFKKEASTVKIDNSSMSAIRKEHARDYVNSLDYSNLNGIIFDATHFNYAQRKAPLEFLKGRLDTYCIYINKPIDECFKNVQKRAKTVMGHYQGKDVFGRFVPLEVLESMSKYTTLPKKSEGFKDVFIIKNNF